MDALVLEKRLEKEGIFIFIAEKEKFTAIKGDVVAEIDSRKIDFLSVDQAYFVIIDALETEAQSPIKKFSYKNAMGMIAGRGLIIARVGWFPNKFGIIQRDGKYIKIDEYWETEYIPTETDKTANDWVFVKREIILPRINNGKC